MNKGKPSSPQKAAAARENGKRGGTKNPNVSKFNALRHGRTAKKLNILEGKHRPEYGKYLQLFREFTASLGATTPEDRLAIEDMVAQTWLKGLSFRMEMEEIAKPGVLNSAAIMHLVRYVSMRERRFDKAYERIQAIRQREEPQFTHPLASAETSSNTPPASGAISELPASESTNQQSEKNASDTLTAAAARDQDGTHALRLRVGAAETPERTNELPQLPHLSGPPASAANAVSPNGGGRSDSKAEQEG